MLTRIRLAVAATAPLAPDETYYWVWSHALAAGYLDHPPMVALWIKAGTALAGQTALGVRLFGPLSAGLASWMLFDAARLLFPGTKAPIVAVLLLNATLLLGVGTVIMTPDSPLLFFWTATFWAMANVAARGTTTTGQAAGPPRAAWWLAAGVFGGLALDSKYTGLFLWIGIAWWVLLVPANRFWLRRWQPWAACLIGFGLFAPVLAWNTAHGLAGFARQGGRVADWQPSRAVGFLGELVVGQIGLATPLVWALCMAGLGAAIRQWRSPAWSLLLALSLPPILMFVQHAFGDRVQGNWPAIIYPALAVAAGGLAVPRRWWAGATALGFAITGLAYVQAATGLIPLPPKFDPIALRLSGWDSIADQLGRVRQTETFVAAEGYAVASELAWWMPGPVVGSDDRWALTTLKPATIAGQRGLLVRDARRTEPPDPAIWGDARLIGSVTRPGASFNVFQVIAVQTGPSLVVLPHR